MCSHEEVTWESIENGVTERMVDNSFMHKLVPSKIRKRTKLLNAELKRHGGVKNYKQYVNLKTTLLRNMSEDSDTDNINLSDVDYDVIYSTPVARAKYVSEHSDRYIFHDEEYSELVERKVYKRKSKSSKTRRSVSSNTKRSVTINTKKVSNSQSSSGQCIGWQNIIKKKNRDSSDFPHNTSQADASNYEENDFNDNDHDYVGTSSNNRSFNSLFDSKDSAANNIMKSKSKRTMDNDENSNVMGEPSSQSDAILCETKPIAERVLRSKARRTLSLNKSNTELKSPSPRSESKMHLTDHLIHSCSKSNNLEKSNKSHNESSIVIKLDNSTELTEMNTQVSTSTKTFSTNTCTNRKLAQNVRKNLMSALEKIVSPSNDDDIKQNDSAKDESNCDRSLLSSTSFTPLSSTPLQKTPVNASITQDSLPNALLFNQQKYSTEEGLENELVENEESNLRSPTSFLADIAEEMLASPSYSKKSIREKAKNVKSANSKRNMKQTPLKYNDNEDNEKQDREAETFSEKIEDSSRLDDPIDEGAESSSSEARNQRDKSEKKSTVLAKGENSCKIKSPRSPEETCVKNGRLKSDDDNAKGGDGREVRRYMKKRKRKNSRLNNDEDAEIYSINHENKIDSVTLEDLCNTRRKQQLSPKKCLKNGYLKSDDDDIAEKPEHEEAIKDPETREREDSLQSKTVDESADAHRSIHQNENKTRSAELGSSYDSQEQLESPRKSPMRHKKKKRKSESHDDGLEIQRNLSRSSSKGEEVRNSPHSNEVDENVERCSVNHADEIDSVTSKGSQNAPRQQLLPKVICNTLINKRYKIINGKVDDTDNNTEKADDTIDSSIDIASEDVPVTKNDTSVNDSSAVDHHDANGWQLGTRMNTEEMNNDVPMVSEISDNEESHANNNLSPQSKKRLQQQATLNLIVYSESSESDDETNVTSKSPKRCIDGSDSGEDDTFKDDDKITCASRKTDGSRGKESRKEDIRASSEEGTPVSEANSRSNLDGIDERTKKIASVTKSTCENDLKKDLSRKTDGYENVRDNESLLLDKENEYDQSSRRDELSNCTREDENKSESNASASRCDSDVEQDIFSNYPRPCNVGSS